MLAQFRTMAASRVGKVLAGCFGVYAASITAAALYLRFSVNGGLFNPVMRSKKNMQGYQVIVTGSNQGIGYEIAKYMVLHGAHCVLACRSDERGIAAEAAINEAAQTEAVYSGGRAEYMCCDLSSLESTKAFITNYKRKKYGLHILVNNAGMGSRNTFKMTHDGVELTWQINYLSHFLITHQLLPFMIRSSVKNPSFDCRIVNTSSLWHKHGHIDIDTLCSDEATQRAKYKGLKGTYGDSKLAQILHTTYLQREILDKYGLSISACSVHPGGVRTNIFNMNKRSLAVYVLMNVVYPAFYFGLRNPEQGARNSIYCAVAPIGRSEWGGAFVPGGYHEDMRGRATRDPHQQSTNVEEMRRLYQYSLDMLNLKAMLPEDYRSLKGQDCSSR